MDASAAVDVPCLALVLGDAVSLTSLQAEFAQHPQGVTYVQFHQLISSYVDAAAARAAVAVADEVMWGKLSTTYMRQSATSARSFSASLSAAAPGTANRRAADTAIEAVATRADTTDAAGNTSFHTAPRTRGLPTRCSVRTAQREEEANRMMRRIHRVETRQELAGMAAASVDPVKQLFNRINVENEQRVTWDNMMNYLVAESYAGMTENPFAANSVTLYSYSRSLRAPPKQGQHIGAHAPGKRGPTRKTAYRRHFLDVQKAETGAKAAAEEAKMDSSTPHVCEDPELAVIKVFDGLESHKSVFFVATRSNPFLLYSKDFLTRVYTSPPDMFTEAAPSLVAYIAANDTFVAYSTDDRLLRGWSSLLTPSFATFTVAPFLVRHFARCIKTMSTASPTYDTYNETLFIGDGQGSVHLVTTQRGRSGYLEFVVQHVLRHLHSEDTGGFVDLCAFDQHVYSAGYDGRLVATSLVSEQSTVLSTLSREHYHSLTYVPSVNRLVAATSGTRQVLYWDADSQSSLPGVSLDLAGHTGHLSSIVSIVYVSLSDHLMSADRSGVVKIWEATTCRCVQSLDGGRTQRGAEDGSGGGDGGEEEEKVIVKAHRTPKGSARVSRRFSTSNAVDDAAGGGASVFSSLLSGLEVDGRMRGPQCIGIAQCTTTAELLCVFTDAVVAWSRYGARSPYACDMNEACQDLLYDVRHHTFLLRGTTQLTVWDSVYGIRRSILDRHNEYAVSPSSVDIRSVCLDDLGSRLFVAAGDGSVYAYSTQALTSDGGGDSDAFLGLWCASPPLRSQLGESAQQQHNAVATAIPGVVEQMCFSSVLRTWVGVTTGGTLLVRTDVGREETPVVNSFMVSAHPLTQLRLSEVLELVAVVDQRQTLYLYDTNAWGENPDSRNLASHGRILDVVFLEGAPALVTVHIGGVCCCWSCPPAVERLELLGIICHPQLGCAEAAAAETELKAELVQRGAEALLRPFDSSITGAAARLTLSNVAKPLPGWSEQESRDGRSHTSFKASVSANAYSPLLLQRQKDACRQDATMAAGERGSVPHALVPESSGLSSSSLPQTASKGAKCTDTFHPSSPSSSIASRPSLKLLRDTLGNTRHDGRSGSGGAEFTAASYDEESHTLFLGDAAGDVHLYRMCPLLRAFQLPLAISGVRPPAFSLLTRERQQAYVTVRATMSGAPIERSMPPAVVMPTLLRSVAVHGLHSDGASDGPHTSGGRGAGARPKMFSPRSRLLGATTAAGDLMMGSEGGTGVLCVRWVPSRQVLATAGQDREVWLLNVEGDHLGFLSAERPPPRIGGSSNTTAQEAYHQALDATMTLRSTEGGLLSGRSSLSCCVAGVPKWVLNDTLALQRPFTLPLAQGSLAVESQAMSRGAFTYCTHSGARASMGDGAALTARPPASGLRHASSRVARTVAVREGATELSGVPHTDVPSGVSSVRPSRFLAEAMQDANRRLSQVCEASSSAAAAAAKQGMLKESKGETEEGEGVSRDWNPELLWNAPQVNPSPETAPVSAAHAPRLALTGSGRTAHATRPGTADLAAAAPSKTTKGSAEDALVLRRAMSAGYAPRATLAGAAQVSTRTKDRRTTRVLQPNERRETLRQAQDGVPMSANGDHAEGGDSGEAARGKKDAAPSITHERFSLPCSLAAAGEEEEAERLSDDVAASLTGVPLYVSGRPLTLPSTRPADDKPIRVLSAGATASRYGLKTYPFLPEASGTPANALQRQHHPPRPRTTSGQQTSWIPQPPPAPGVIARESVLQGKEPTFPQARGMSPMVAYSSVAEAEATLNMYSRELQQRLRRPLS